jgi:glycosyltransferase involved in cell wall biosynthesis
MIPEPFVSVLTPVYNGDRYLAECIESVVGQDYTNWEYLIVNNCSTDGSLALAESYAARDNRIRVVTNEKFVGVVENHNNAFRQMSPQSVYCKVLCADDLLLPQALGKMVRFAAQNPTVGIVGSYPAGRFAGLSCFKVLVCLELQPARSTVRIWCAERSPFSHMTSPMRTPAPAMRL